MTGTPLARVGVMRTSVPWRAVVVFAVVSAGLAWLVALPLWLRGQGLNDVLFSVLASAMMWTPAIAAFVAIRVDGRRLDAGTFRDLGLWPLRPARRTILMSLAAIVAMPVLIVIGIAVSSALGLAKLDLVGFSGFAAQLAAAGATSVPPIVVLVVLQLALIPVGAVMNSIVTLGEEIGWRGWLLPALRPLGTWPALLISGAFWGLWHAPLILLGYNFDKPNLLGVLMMIVACTLVGVLFGWTRLRTGSVWPAVVAHGALNASGNMLALVIAADSPAPDVALAGPLGIVMWAVFAVTAVALLLAGQFGARRLSATLAAPAAPAVAPQ